MRITGDSFPGVRVLSAESVRKIGAQRYLGCAVRSQGFSPSQRFDPTEPCDGFHVTSAHRVWVVFRALFRAVSREPSRVALLSCR